ncbi:MAG TPA: EamA family transporter [Ktedonobacterales bacterium]|nr:EamA family transporter [Ktedonobacterales bacterium]
MPSASITTAPSRVKVLSAFAIVYVIWGSTYLAISFGVKTLPPFLFAATRFLLAGAILYVFARRRGAPRPTRIHWRSALIIGGLLLVGGNGLLVFAERTVPSGIAALIVSTSPIWMALLDWIRPGGARPRFPVIVGLVIGFGGVALLIGPNALHGHLPLAGALIVVAGSLGWAAGSVYSRYAPFPKEPLLGSGIEMLAGGALLVVLSLATGEMGQVHLRAVSTRSVLALVYLILFGSIVAFSAYTWLLRNVALSRVSTYAYVNPVVAVLLGWAFNGESVGGQTLLAAGVIVAAVVVITTFHRHDAHPKPEAAPATSAPAASHAPDTSPRLAVTRLDQG